MIRIAIADDHQIIRDGLRVLIEKQPNMEVVAEAGNGRAIVQLVEELSPDVIIMDVAMPELNGIEATRKMLVSNPDVKVIALSMHSDKRFVTEMLRAGAAGYLLKDCAFEELALAIATVVEGKTYLSPGIAGIVALEYVRRTVVPRTTAYSLLSDREREVLQLLAEGRRTKEVATTLNVSVKTVETHRQNIMSKLNIHTVAELTKYAIREGLTSLDD